MQNETWDCGGFVKRLPRRGRSRAQALLASRLFTRHFVAQAVLIERLANRLGLEPRAAVIGLLGDAHGHHAHPRFIELDGLDLLSRGIQRNP